MIEGCSSDPCRRISCYCKIPDHPPNPKAFVGFKKVEPGTCIKRKVQWSGSKQMQEIQRGMDFGLLRNSTPFPESHTPIPKNRPTNHKARRYSGTLSLILQALNSNYDLERILNSSCQNLSPKEQTIVLKEQRKWENVVRVFEFFKGEDDYAPNVIHYNIVIRAVGRAQQWDKLELFWREMAEKEVVPTTDTYGTLIDVCGKAGRFDISLNWIDRMNASGIFPDEVTLNTVLKVTKDAREYEMGEKFYDSWCDGQESVSRDFRRPGRTTTYNSLIDLYGKAGRIEKARNAFEEMEKRGISKDVITYNTMIFTLGSHGFLSETEELLKKMEVEDVSPDTRTYNILLSLNANAGKLDAAFEWLRKIREVGLSPDIVTYRAFLHILCERRMMKEVEDVIEEMRKTHSRIDEHSLPGIANMYVSEGLLSEAADLLVEYEKLSPKTRAAILDVYAEKGLWREAEDLFGKTEQKDVVEYNVMIKAYGLAKLYAKAFELLKSMRKMGLMPDSCTFNSIVQMFSCADEAEFGRELLKEMKGKGLVPHCATYSNLIGSYVRLGRVSDAASVYEEMVGDGVSPNEFVFGALIDGYAENGDLEESLKYFRIMQDLKVPANKIVLTSLIKVYSKLSLLGEAKNAYELLKESNGGADVIASNTMVKAFAEMDLVGEAEALFGKMKEERIADGFTYGTMIGLYKKLGMVSEAVNIARQMEGTELLTDAVAYNNLMWCYVTDGQLRKSGELLHEMVEKGLTPDDRSLKILVALLKKGGVAEDAVNQLEMCCQEGRQGAPHALFATVFAAVGFLDLARTSCERLLDGPFPLQLFLVNTGIHIYGLCGELDRAFDLYLKMQDQGIQPDHVTYLFLVTCYGKAGLIEGVKRIYWLLLDGHITPSQPLLLSIAYAFKINNRRLPPLCIPPLT